MFVYKIMRIGSRIKFIIKVAIWKLIFRGGFIFPLYYKSCIDSGAAVKNINGTINFRGKFISRRNLSINVTNGNLSIGHDVFFNQGVSINCQGNIYIGDFTIFGEDVKIYDHNHKFSSEQLTKNQGFTIKSVNIGANVWVGSNVIILSGVNVGNNSVISAGSIVREDVPENMLFKNGELIEIKKRKL